ncbi:coiled-coil domain-containing protein 190 isoform X1 [Lepus europaeus]|uniref:coiled-coil domain-containing protein 190 isoform X1 n=1 Tax=Lepus europaeus TaxID=9983 RepID=UPI002B4A346C|nr:coiled-coil domain-containing protein 190 isoform X1 [Lepus europaeus]
MKRVERHVVKGARDKHFDLERKSAKQAEARLSQRLRSLEEICLYHMKSLTREQRQLQKELQRLQQEIIKKKLSSYFGNGIQKRPEDILKSSQGKQQLRVPQTDHVGPLATNTAPETYSTRPQRPPSHPTGLKDSMRNKEQQSQNDRTACLTEEMPQAQGKDSIKAPKGGDPNKGISALCHHQAVSTNSSEKGPSSSPASDSGVAPVDENRSQDANLKPGMNAGIQIPPHFTEDARESTKQTFLELLAKVKNAHYLRHRVPPESERLLSIAEIFGHGESPPRREREESEKQAPSNPFSSYLTQADNDT